MAGRGNPPGVGRPRGVPNKFTASIKQAFQEAFEQRGGVPALTRWAQANETEFYKLVARLIPTDITSDGKPLTLTAEERVDRLAALVAAIQGRK